MLFTVVIDVIDMYVIDLYMNVVSYNLLSLYEIIDNVYNTDIFAFILLFLSYKRL